MVTRMQTLYEACRQETHRNCQLFRRSHARAAPHFLVPGRTSPDQPLTLDQYLEELAKLVLEKNWAHKIRDTIISSKQGDRPFIDWKIKIENLNAILTTSSPTHALTEAGLKIQLEANLNSKLKINLLNEPALFDKLDA